MFSITIGTATGELILMTFLAALIETMSSVYCLSTDTGSMTAPENVAVRNNGGESKDFDTQEDLKLLQFESTSLNKVWNWFGTDPGGYFGVTVVISREPIRELECVWWIRDVKWTACRWVVHLDNVWITLSANYHTLDLWKRTLSSSNLYWSITRN